ncbi:MAG: hypothetical protein J0L92_23925 [Deltaproteobacteria bacterium]|nr:hypothetical protein [Deltaproteobacteria bacterium]
MRVLESLAIVVALCAAGCGGGTGGGDDAATAPDASSEAPDAAGGGAPDTGPMDDAGTAMPGTPVLLSATLVVHGTHALSWRLPDSGCDEVVINRNRDGGPYTEATRLTGVATEAQSMAGHASGTYCYTVACVLGGVTSDASNEQCVSQ